MKTLSEVRKIWLRVQTRPSIETQRMRFYVDFRPIRNLSPAGALVLVAELDRVARALQKTDQQLVSRDVDQWNVAVRRQFADMGLFSFLKVEYPTDLARADAHTQTIRYVPFRTGTVADGETFERLRKSDLAPHVTVPYRHNLFAAVTEAMTNVRYHAYKGISTIGAPRNWWLSAMYDTKRGQFSVLIYDQGEGIPKTLPRNFEEYLGRLFTLESDDAHLIEAAHDIRRTATKEEHRGHGMGTDIRAYARQIGSKATYRVISGRGSYTFRLDENGDEDHLKKTFPSRLEGTLIEWRVN